MRAGKLDRRITIQRKTETVSPGGSPIETWTAVAHRRAASVAPLRGEERFSDPKFSANEQVEIRIRWGSSVADITPRDRVLYPPPADQDEQSPVDTSIYDVMAVHELGRREGLKILAVRRTDTQ